MADQQAPSELPGYGYRSEQEHRLPATVAILLSAVIYSLLPAKLIFGPRYVLPVLELIILIPIAVSNPMKITKESRNLRGLSFLMIGLVNLANAINLALLCYRLVAGGSTSGRSLIYASGAIWVTNVLIFGLWFWELDRGGPYARCSNLRRNPDFLFPQMSNPETARKKWVPTYMDYLYVSFTNALAFSPTDTMPLTPMAKFLMLTQSLVSVITVVLVAARAVNILH
ncbi:MAG: hypothetical protein M0Z39_10090 [Actinomycetota bacterium]|nr:hypothetical protein [Actinomycetota bacterium]